MLAITHQLVPQANPGPAPTPIGITNADVHTRIRSQLLGHPCVAIDAGAVPLGANCPGQLLAYLAVRGLWQTRDEVARLFWPDRPSKMARINLRNWLGKTAATLPFAFIESTAHSPRFTAPSDLNGFEAAVQ